MARAIADIEKDIRALTADEKLALLRSLLRDLDGPVEPNVEKAWLLESQRRYREIVDGSVEGVPGHLVFERLRSRLAR